MKRVGNLCGKRLSPNFTSNIKRTIANELTSVSPEILEAKFGMVFKSLYFKSLYFASLFRMSKREHLRNKEKCFLFHFESSSRS